MVNDFVRLKKMVEERISDQWSLKQKARWKLTFDFLQPFL